MKDGGSNAQDDAAPDALGLPSRPNILVVDDEGLSRCIVSTLLIKCNYRGARRWFSVPVGTWPALRLPQYMCRTRLTLHRA